MKKLIAISASVATGVVIAVAVAAPVLAWHPKGEIKKYVTNVTQNGQKSDANDAASAVQAKTGDVLKYTIEIKNTAAPAQKEWNDLHYIELKDTLPEGVVLVSDPAKRQITESLGMLKPGQRVTREYTVKVVSETDEQVITNKACFKGDSKVRDNKQSGCDNAVVEVFVPQTSSTVTEKPGQGATKAAVTELPKTGAASVATAFVGTTGISYAIHSVARKLRIRK